MSLDRIQRKAFLPTSAHVHRHLHWHSSRISPSRMRTQCGSKQCVWGVECVYLLRSSTPEQDVIEMDCHIGR
ncbi:hypothetical protein M404DRAFT_996704 [Pisolithus tinctorius Marx 270]|uniref:Uncharacterized protein n=1 Tax=Pisolithus tinctorius Marx 270 TaxID=870435 RepID=A0A0C3PK35_PISTI|nr:hypothetical protein M404DRAFT_996704 [Pisolithus tinctorius Marx 270]